MKLSIKSLEKYHLKIFGLLGLIIIFAILYLFLDSTHFHGINQVEDKIKDKIIEKEVDKDNLIDQFNTRSYEKHEKKKNIEDAVNTEENKLENPSNVQMIFDRIYFSTITACLLGYGDIYPASNTTKGLCALQSFLTVCLILY